MKYIYGIIFFFLLSTFYVCGQGTRKHVVQRGETLESIAQNNGVSSDELRKANMDMNVFYTGLEIDIPVKKMVVAQNGAKHSPHSDEQFAEMLAAYRNECEIADRLFEAQKYSKAQKRYRQTIKKYKGVLPCDDALYGNALCSYNREKWKSAIEDLSIVINSEECTKGQRDHCKRLLSKAQSYRDQQLEDRSNLLGGLFVTAATIGTSIAIASSQSSQSAYSNPSSSFGSTSSTIGASYSSEEISGSVSSSGKSSCPSLKVNRGKWYCANTGRCGMCGGDGLMDDQFGHGANSHKCTLCGGTGKCKYCQ